MTPSCRREDTYRQRERQRDRERETHTQRERERERERDSHSHTCTHAPTADCEQKTESFTIDSANIQSMNVSGACGSTHARSSLPLVRAQPAVGAVLQIDFDFDNERHASVELVFAGTPADADGAL